MNETWVPSLGQEDPVFLVNPMDRGGLVGGGVARVRHDLVTEQQQ